MTDISTTSSASSTSTAPSMASTATTSTASSTASTATTATLQPQTCTMATVAVKLPSFWTEDPHVWFLQVEEQFKLARVTTETTKYSHLVTSLPPKVMMDLRDVLVQSHTNPYTTLKAVILKRTAATQKEKLQQLLQAEALGDRTPSQLLRAMSALYSTTPVSEPLFRELFISRLPTACQPFLALLPDATPLDQLAEVADRVVASTPTVPASIAAVSSPAASTFPAHSASPAPTPSPESTGDANILAAIKSLTEQVAEIKADRNTTQQPRSPRRWHNRSRFRVDSPPQSTGICVYHRRFGNRARMCRKPCSYYYQGNDQASGQ